jgi:Uma2 family endonuclease
MTAVTLNLQPLLELTDDAFYELCRANPEVKLERTARGELVVMSLTGGEMGDRNRRITQRLGNWTDEDSTGLSFDSSACFRLPNSAERPSYRGAIRSPNAAWVSLERWHALTPEQRQKFPPLVPEFVVELRSPDDDLGALQFKMQEYLENGVRLGWLIDPQHQRVEVYRHGQAVEILEAPGSLSGEETLPNFVLDLDRIL